MGYPMTWRRLINRNALGDGDYGQPPIGWANEVSLSGHVGLDDPHCGFESVKALEQAYRDSVLRRNQERQLMAAKISALAGDFHRLERDSIDEHTICQVIASKTGLAPDTVAAVLKEWIAT